MTSILLRTRALPLVAALAAGAPLAHAFNDSELAALGDGHFARLYGFDALEAYRARRGRASASFVVMRRWQGGQAQVLIDVREPSSFRKWAILMLQRGHRSDDLFAYIPAWRRVQRLNPGLLQQPIFDLISLGDLRPISPGELAYVRLPNERVEGELCVVLEGRPLHRGLGFERVELALSGESGFALRTRYFRGDREMRRVLISPGDLRRFGGRELPSRRRILVDPEGEPTVVDLVNVMVDPLLPARLFSPQSLKSQHFPSF